MSDTWKCPRCGEIYQKLAPGFLGENLVKTIGLSGPFQCPKCGKSVDIKKIYAGKYDTGKKWWQFWK
jgi:predicted RNA-binding Zn-ribbon protein involved in translation (DUF1610 family)